MTNHSYKKKRQYKYLAPTTTRWADNDIYGHVNNVTYYAFFDSAVNRYLIEKGGLDIHSGPVIGFVVSSNCNYFKPVSYPQNIEVGVGIRKLGNSSVTYQVAIFTENEDEAIALGEFVHVFVNRETQEACPIPVEIRKALTEIVLD